MLSHTLRALEDFDNQHDFERMAADVLNALGYTGVEPMAPAGGPDGGQDIRFTEGDSPGIAFVTLNKRIDEKFRMDLAKQTQAEGVVALFCNVTVSPSQKLGMAREAISQGYRLEIFDLERLRSLLDGSLKDIRRRYLGVDDEIAARLRSEVTKLLRFPSAVADDLQPPTVIERLLLDQLPRRLFDLLMHYEQSDIVEVPGIGAALQGHLLNYYEFREQALELEKRMSSQIGPLSVCRFPVSWRIYLRYVLMRFAGLSRQDVEAGGDFLNYGITWDGAECVYQELAADEALSATVARVIRLHVSMAEGIRKLREPALPQVADSPNNGVQTDNAARCG